MKRFQIDSIPLIFGIALFAFVMVAPFVQILTQSVQAQSPAPAWEYAIMFYSEDDVFAFTDDPAETNALNKLFEEDGESVGLLAGLNVMGAESWELASVVTGTTSVYMFKRPLE